MVAPYAKPLWIPMSRALVESTVYCLDSGLHDLRKLADYCGCSRAMDTERLRNGERKKKRDVGRLSRMFSADPSAAQVLGTRGTCSLTYLGAFASRRIAIGAF